MDALTTIELVLRTVAVITLLTATFYLAYSIYKRQVEPRFVWIYLLVTLVIGVIFRATVLAIMTGAVTGDIAQEITNWQNTINQSWYMMISFAIILLIRAHILGRRRHYRNEHFDV